jgi:hypothetical protein
MGHTTTANRFDGDGFIPSETNLGFDNFFRCVRVVVHVAGLTATALAQMQGSKLEKRGKSNEGHVLRASAKLSAGGFVIGGPNGLHVSPVNACACHAHVANNPSSAGPRRYSGWEAVAEVHISD